MKITAKKICEACKKQYFPRKGEGNKAWKNRKYCSPFCNYQAKRKDVLFICEKCGLEKYKKSNEKNKRFCSRKCMILWRSKEIVNGNITWKNHHIFGKRDSNPNWKGGVTPINNKIRKSDQYKKWRQKVLERDDFTCQECDKHGGDLNVHHLKEFSLFTKERLELNNAKTLCTDCHRKTFGNIRNKIGIVGLGWVGKSMLELFPSALVYDHHRPDLFTKNDINKYCSICFICVPTPCINEGMLDISIVEEVVAWCTCPLLIIRSTVNPGTCDMLVKKYNKHIIFQPEYLGESPAHPMLDPKTRPFLIMGGDPKDTRKLIEVYGTVYNANTTIRQVSAIEAEIIKLSENRAIAFKVAECQELYDACESAKIDYYSIRDAVYGDDPRFNLWWTLIYPDKRGFNSKCIPKDVYAWCAWAESTGYNPKVTRAILLKNKEWIT